MSTALDSSDDLQIDLRVARRLSPEDIRRGDTVMVSDIQYEFPTFFWCDADMARMPPERPIRMSFRARAENGPYVVLAVCLPYVLCRCIQSKKRQLLDIRQLQLMKLDASFAKAARKMLRPKSTKKRKKSKKSAN